MFTFALALGDMKKNRKTTTTTRREFAIAVVEVAVVIMTHKWRGAVWMQCRVQGRRKETKQTKQILVVCSSTLCRRRGR